MAEKSEPLLSRRLSEAERELVAAAREKAHILYEGTRWLGLLRHPPSLSFSMETSAAETAGGSAPLRNTNAVTRRVVTLGSMVDSPIFEAFGSAESLSGTK